MKRIPWDLIISKLKNTTTTTEEKEWKQWIAKGDNKLLFIEIQTLWDEVRATVVDYKVDTDACWQELQRRMAAREKKAVTEEPKPQVDQQKVRSLKPAMRRYIAAASIVAVVFLASAFYLGVKISETSVLEQSYTNWGGKSELQLPDATDVWVHTNTTLAYNTDFKSRNRVVKLSGQAYFDVRHDKKNPFIVEAEGLRVVVHGTKFNVEALPDSEEIIVSLKEGSVSLEAKNINRYMRPGEVAVYNKKHQQVTIDRGDVDLAISWADNEREFNDMGLGEICRYLSKWYNVKIQLAPGLENKYQYTFKLRSEPLEEILRIMTRIHPISYSFDELNVLTLSEDDKKKN